MDIKEHKAYQYALSVARGEVIAGKYIIKECKKFVEDIMNMDKEDFPYFFDTDEAEKITNLTKLINMASGPAVGKPTHDALAGFQWYFILNALCWKHKDKPEKRRYERSVLLIARKSGKSFLVGLIFIILLLIEPKFSEFYSVAPDRELSSIVKKELEQMIQSSPYLLKYFETTRAETRCRVTKSKFIPLATSENRMDGRKANVFVADEVGALRNRYPIDAMQSSQMNMINRTAILISTAYESLNNPMTEEIEYCEKVLDGLIDDETTFALLYKPDDPKDWLSDKSLIEANPLIVDIKENFDYLVKQRKTAIEMPSSRKNFLTKHMNIFVDGDDAEVYIPTDDLIKCRLEEPYDWHGRDVYIGVDLSISTDNTAVTMVHYDSIKQKFYSKAWAFVPEDNADNKSKLEKVDYRLFARQGYCYLCGDRIISYSFVEDFVLNLEREYGVNIKGIGYDKYNAVSSANKWYEAGYEVIEIKQHSSTLHPATKLLKESVFKEQFAYEQNRLYELNFSNAREMKDSMLNSYINKKKSTGKVDMVAATINAMVLWNQEIVDGLSIYDREDDDRDELGFIFL
jgi:phage terminase large subunit-like protein